MAGFEEALERLRSQGYILSNLIEFTHKKETPFRVCLRHHKYPTCLGFGWANNPTDALSAAVFAFQEELAFTTSTPKTTVSLEDLDLA